MTREERKEYNYWLIRRKINGIIEKQCTRCHEWKEENINNYYYKNKSKLELGYSAECRKCGTKRSITIRHEDIDKTRKNDLKYYYNNKEKCFIRMDNYKRKNKDSWDNYHKNYLINNKDKTKKYTQKRKSKEHKITDKEWKACKEYFNNECAYCGFPEKDHYRLYSGEIQKTDLHKEHVIDDGRNDIKNCIPSCLSCNSIKHKKTVNEFYNKDNPTYTYERYHKIYMWLRYDYKKYITKKRYYKRKPKQI